MGSWKHNCQWHQDILSALFLEMSLSMTSRPSFCFIYRDVTVNDIKTIFLLYLKRCHCQWHQDLLSALFIEMSLSKTSRPSFCFFNRDVTGNNIKAFLGIVVLVLFNKILVIVFIMDFYSEYGPGFQKSSLSICAHF